MSTRSVLLPRRDAGIATAALATAVLCAAAGLAPANAAPEPSTAPPAASSATRAGTITFQTRIRDDALQVRSVLIEKEPSAAFGRGARVQCLELGVDLRDDDGDGYAAYTRQLVRLERYEIRSFARTGCADGDYMAGSVGSVVGSGKWTVTGVQPPRLTR